jgi:hypothetical protein
MIRRRLSSWPAQKQPALNLAPPTDRVLQQLTRYRSAEGGDALLGQLVAEFQPGERHAVVYVAFCPPFERLPQAEAHLAEDIVATVKLTQVLHNGAQVDVALPCPAASNMSVSVELFAVASPKDDL